MKVSEMFTIYDLRDIIQTAFWGGMLVLILIGWGILKANQARMRFYVAWLIIVPAGFLALILPSPKEYREAKERKQRYETAKAIFEEQCKNAGEKIYRTVDNVEGIMLLKVVPKSNYSSADAKSRDPMWDNAALQSSEGEHFIGEMLGIYSAFYNGGKYQYVDILQDNQIDIIRYIGNEIPLEEYKNPKKSARYAVTFQVDNNPELRKHWVAGATIQIIDRQTNEIIAEKVTYAFETGLGSQVNVRMPWNLAISCENKEMFTSAILPNFTNKVLKSRNFKQ